MLKPFERAKFRVKIRSLAAEAKIIRHEEGKRCDKRDYLKYHWSLREGLRAHRVNIVRPEARATLLAYAFLLDKPYSRVETSNSETPDLKRISQIIKSLVGQYVPPDVLMKWMTPAPVAVS